MGTITRKKIRRGLARFLTAWTHFKKRLLERYNMAISQDEYKKLVKDVKKEKMEQFLTQAREDGSKIYRIPIHGELVKIVYKTKEKLLSTVLPKWENKLKIK